jgi:hypothetical protein
MRNEVPQRGATECFAKAGLAEGTNANTIKINAPNGAGIDFSINGVAYHKADTDNIAITAAAVQADLTKCLYLVQIDSDGTVSTVKGTEELTADLVSGKRVLHWPEPAANKCPIGAVKVENIAGTFTAGSTDLGAGTVTDTYYDFAGGMPVAPLTA